MKTTIETATTANRIRRFLKENNFNHATVKVSGNRLIIDNLNGGTAQNIAEHVTGKRYDYLGISVTRLSN